MREDTLPINYSSFEVVSGTSRHGTVRSADGGESKQNKAGGERHANHRLHDSFMTHLMDAGAPPWIIAWPGGDGADGLPSAPARIPSRACYLRQPCSVRLSFPWPRCRFFRR